MAWTWTSNFANFKDGWEPGNDLGLGDQAIWTAGIGWQSTDISCNVGEFCRALRIDFNPSSPVTIDTIELSYNYTKGTFFAVANALQIFTDVASTSITSAAIVNGNDQIKTLTVSGATSTIIVFLRSSDQLVAAYDGSVFINYIKITGPTGSLNPFESDRQFQSPIKFIDDQGGAASGGAGGGAGGNIADISADGLYIYIATFDTSNNPILIKILSTLTADGTVVFNPGAGGRIGVKTSRFNASHVWVAGEFDGTNTVEKTEDAGSNFTVKDTGAFGAIRSFALGPDNDDRVLLFDGDNGDLIESIDGGDTWTTVNAAVTPLVNTIARYSQNAQEIVIGNQGAANNSIDYSVNTGVNLEDYQTGVYPNINARKVITS